MNPNQHQINWVDNGTDSLKERKIIKGKTDFPLKYEKTLHTFPNVIH